MPCEPSNRTVAAVYTIEEIEETAKLLITLQGHKTHLLNPTHINDVIPVFSDKDKNDGPTCC